jgi:hypothetical protein
MLSHQRRGQLPASVFAASPRWAAAIVFSNDGDLWSSARLPVTRKMSDGRDTLASARPRNGQVVA